MSPSVTATIGCMFGGILIVVFLLIVFPVTIMMTGAALAALLGQTTKAAVDSTHEGSELLEISEANPYSGS